MPEPWSKLTRLFRRHKVMDMETMAKAFTDRSRRTLFRGLVQLGYHSSYTHAGRYYTLTDIPVFDDFGVWFFKDVGFCESGTLKAALVDLIERAEAGQTHHELEALFRVRVHNSLLILVRQKRVDRVRLERVYLYVSTKSKKASRQIAKRREKIAAAMPLTDAVIVEVLLEVVRAGEITIPPTVVSDRLKARGVLISTAQAQQVFDRYGLEVLKKTAASHSKRSKT